MKSFRLRSRVCGRISVTLICALLCLALTACGGGTAGGTAFTAAQGPADSVLPYQAAFAVSAKAGERLIAAAQNFCSRTADFSQNDATFSLITSENPLQDLKTGKAAVILLENAEIDALSPIAESFRYKNYEHFAMTVNSAAVLEILSCSLGANVFAGFYTGSDVFVSHGTLDAKFRPLPRKDAEDAREAQPVSAFTRSDSTARAFTALKASASVTKDLDMRIRACSLPNAVVEFSYPELTSPALLAALRNAAKAVEAAPVAESSGTSEDAGENADNNSDDDAKPLPADPEPLTATPAFTGARPVWLVFAPDVYEKLSQTNRAAVAEAAAYMVTDIDGAHLAYEREILDLLTEEDVEISDNFAVTRLLALRHADGQAANLTGTERKLRDAVADLQ